MCSPFLLVATNFLLVFLFAFPPISSLARDPSKRLLRPTRENNLSLSLSLFLFLSQPPHKEYPWCGPLSPSLHISIATLRFVHLPSSKMMQGDPHQELGMHMSTAAAVGECSSSVPSSAAAEEEHRRLLKAEISVHPLLEQLLSAHIGCLRVATPIDHLPLIDAQLSQSHHLLRSYAALHRPLLSPPEKLDLDNFLAQYSMLLCSFKEQLQQHVRVHAVEAVMACREIEQSLHELTGVTLDEGTGATMSDDEDDLQLDCSLDPVMDGHDLMGFGPLLPTESERSLMERVRQELKLELKQGFRSRIEDVREEIMRKRRAGKLPGDTTSVLKQWWQQHSKWPYPTEDDKAKLVEETGLQLKQINNWFINQRKRNWHNNSQSATSCLKSKRKR